MFGVLLLQTVSLVVFSCGFFYIHPTIRSSNTTNTYSTAGNTNFKGLNNHLALITSAYVSTSTEIPRPPFDKVVFVVIDALRYDFVYGDQFQQSFKWIRSQINQQDVDGQNPIIQ